MAFPLPFTPPAASSGAEGQPYVSLVRVAHVGSRWGDPDRGASWKDDALLSVGFWGDRLLIGRADVLIAGDVHRSVRWGPLHWVAPK